MCHKSERSNFVIAHECVFVFFLLLLSLLFSRCEPEQKRARDQITLKFNDIDVERSKNVVLYQINKWVNMIWIVITDYRHRFWSHGVCVCVYICAYHIWFFIFSPFSPSILFLVFTREILQHSITRLVLFCWILIAVLFECVGFEYCLLYICLL